MSRAVEYPAPLQELVRQLKRLPGVGPRSAERMALWMLSRTDSRPEEIIAAIDQATRAVAPCQECGFFSVTELCEICRDSTRRSDSLCIVENATDILPIERTGTYRGLYHALGGRLSPLDHIGPEQLRIDPLLRRVETAPPQEIILALGADVEGEATAHYLANLLRPSGIAITRLAQGISAGGALETADELSLGKAFSGRFKMS